MKFTRAVWSPELKILFADVNCEMEIASSDISNAFTMPGFSHTKSKNWLQNHTGHALSHKLGSCTI